MTTEKRYGADPKIWWEQAREDPTRYGTRSKLFVASMLLAQEIAKILTAQGIPATERHKMVDPAAPHLLTKPDDDPRPQPEFDGIMSVNAQVNGQDAILPVCPATSTLRLYLLAGDGETNEYGEPRLVTLLSDVPVTSQNDGWTTATAIADAIHAATRNATS